MYIFVLIIHIIVSLMLIAVILLQAGKGGGLAETFGGGGSSQTTIFGKKTSDLLTKATEVSAVLFLCTSLSLAFLSSKRQKSLMEGVQVIPAAQQAVPTEAGQEESATKESAKATTAGSPESESRGAKTTDKVPDTAK